MDRALDGFRVTREPRFDHDELDGRNQHTNTQSDEPAESSDCALVLKRPLLSAEALKENPLPFAHFRSGTCGSRSDERIFLTEMTTGLRP